MAAVVEDRDGLLESALAGQPEHIAHGLVLREVLAEFADAAVVAEGLFRLAGAVDAPLVAYDEGQARYEEGRLPRAAYSVSRESLASLRKICRSAQ